MILSIIKFNLNKGNIVFNVLYYITKVYNSKKSKFNQIKKLVNKLWISIVNSYIFI